MDSQVINYQCPACCAPLHFGGGSGKLECDYCGSSFEVQEIEAMLKEQAEKAAAAMRESENSSWEYSESSEDWGEDSEKMKTYTCPSCAAQLICDETTAATCCPYCGNQTVVPGQFSGSLKPEFVIPFKTDKEAAIAALQRHYKGKKLLPKSFVSGNHVEDIQGVYVPFWMFDCEASGEVEFAATTSTERTVGNQRVKTIKHYDVKRSGTLAFQKVPVDASSRMPDAHMDSIEPYDLKDLKEFSMAYMPGFLADKYDVTAEDCGSRMQERCESTFLSEMQKTVTGYETVTRRSKAVSVKKGAVHYAMLPVWMLSTKWNDQNFLFAMNGQTGKLVGDLPVDMGIYWKYFAGISAAMLVIMNLINWLIFSTPMTGISMILMCIGLPFLIAFLTCSSMKAQMKSIGKQLASAYISASGLRLTKKQDTYVRTSTQTTNISSPGK